MTVTCWVEADRLLQRNGKPVPTHKVANNTHLQRRSDYRIAVRLHDTDVVTYAPRGITLDTGGWLTPTTLRRINTFTPPMVQVVVIKGRWMIHTSKFHQPDMRGGAETTLFYKPYQDGMSLAPITQRYATGEQGISYYIPSDFTPEDERQREDAHNRSIDKLIDRWLRSYTLAVHERTTSPGPSGYGQTMAGHLGCGLCVRTAVGVTAGEMLGDAHHLIDHLLNKQYPPSLFWIACEKASPAHAYRRLVDYNAVKREVRHYLRTLLYRGAVSRVRKAA